MVKITALHGGGDWTDASAEYMVLPAKMDIRVEAENYNKWYKTEYCPAYKQGRRPEYLSLYAWLLSRGARDPAEDELDIFEE